MKHSVSWLWLFTITVPFSAHAQSASPVRTLMRADGSFRLPTTLGKIQKDLGRRYTRFEWENPEASPGGWGNRCYWNFRGGLLLGAQTDSFNKKARLTDSVRGIYLEPQGARVVPTLYGLTFNRSTVADCRTRFGAALKLRPYTKNTFELKGKRLYTYLTFNKKGRLTEILQTTVDMETAG